MNINQFNLEGKKIDKITEHYLHLCFFFTDGTHLTIKARETWERDELIDFNEKTDDELGYINKYHLGIISEHQYQEERKLAIEAAKERERIERHLKYLQLKTEFEK